MRGREQIFGGECVVRSAGVRRRCEGEWKCSEGGEKMLGVGADLRRGMGCEGGEFNALSPQRLARTRIIIIRPPCPRCEIAAMGMKDAPCEHPSPAKTSAPAPSAFIFPRPRSHFLRMAFGLPPNDVRPCRAGVHTSPASPSAAPAEQSASRSSSYPQCVIHGKVIHIVARRPVQNVLALAPAHAYI